MSNVETCPVETSTPAVASQDAIMQELMRLRAENANLKDKKARKEKAEPKEEITFSVSQKCAIAICGLRGFPVTLYREDCEKLFAPEVVARLMAFIEAHKDVLAEKPNKK